METLPEVMTRVREDLDAVPPLMETVPVPALTQAEIEEASVRRARERSKARQFVEGGGIVPGVGNRPDKHDFDG